MTTILHKRTNIYDNIPSNFLKYGELGINYKTGSECIFLKNDSDSIVKIQNVNLDDYPTINDVQQMINDSIIMLLNTPI